MNIRELLLFNLFLQVLDGCLTYQSLSMGAYEANPFVASAVDAWGIVRGVLYYKVFASALLVLIYVLRRGREELATGGFTVTAYVYFCLAVVSLWPLTFSG